MENMNIKPKSAHIVTKKFLIRIGFKNKNTK